jgi:hypothetical protein
MKYAIGLLAILCMPAFASQLWCDPGRRYDPESTLAICEDKFKTPNGPFRFENCSQYTPPNPQTSWSNTRWVQLSGTWSFIGDATCQDNSKIKDAFIAMCSDSSKTCPQ